MKTWSREWLGWVLYIYTMITVFLWVIRATGDDCKLRYMDFLFPLSRLHCEVK